MKQLLKNDHFKWNDSPVYLQYKKTIHLLEQPCTFEIIKDLTPYIILHKEIQKCGTQQECDPNSSEEFTIQRIQLLNSQQTEQKSYPNGIYRNEDC